MSNKTTPPSPLSLLLRAHFPGLKFESQDYKIAGKKLRDGGPEAVISYLTGKGQAKLKDVKPPAKAFVIAQSRPFIEWDLVRVSRQIQEKIFGIPATKGRPKQDGLSETAFNEAVASLEVDGKSKLNEETRAAFYEVLGLDAPSLHAQAQNALIKSAISIREGVLKKVENRNEKNLSKTKRRKEAGEEATFVEEKAHDERGYLIHPPGVNQTIPGYQAVVIKSCPSDFIGLPSGCLAKESAEALTDYLPHDRMTIPKGQPGYVPEWQHPLLNRRKNRRRRDWYSASLNKPKATCSKRSGTPNRKNSRTDQIQSGRFKGAIPVLMRFQDEWVIIDIRGLLRNARYRKLLKEKSTIPDLLSLFTGDPSIDMRQGVCTFIYKAGQACSAKMVKTKNAPEILSELTKSGPVVLVSIDLGQTNPIAAKVSRVTQLSDGQLSHETLLRELLSNDSSDGKEIARYRVASDRLRDKLANLAVERLSPEHKSEILRAKNDTPALCKARVCAALGLNPEMIAWDKMTPYTEFLATAYLEKGGDRKVATLKPKNRPEMLRRDIKFKGTEGVRIEVSPEAAEAYREAQWDLQRTSPEYLRLSTWKQELTKRILNQLRHKAAKSSQCEVVVMAFEDLNIKMMHGNGKWADGGWDAFFIKKRENRWFMQAFHKSLTELGAHKGVPTIEVTPHRTSITCTKCGHCDKANRDGERFACQKCGFVAHADLEIATDNIERVALTGKPMPKPESERSGDAKKSVGARKAAFKPEEDAEAAE